ncbi:MAG: STAS domain-containing protein [Thauera sp.]|jgi:phospholipid transport system transporter-binding protein|nr:STAS domain-containing protein [Thauera sp.]MBP7443218.1 STAS domain-containing protein [Thauera sp.]MBP7467617.1 STAS domain-containing protein [Thauera sp.]MBP8216853.1 STAS domain-containing protein [Thauera sp.]
MSAQGGAVTVFAPAGELTMVSAPAVLEDGRRLARAGDMVVDFAGVTVADSAALALLLDWMRCARAAGNRLAVRGLPAAMASLAALYDIDALLPLESAL